MTDVKIPPPVSDFFGRLGTVLTSKTTLFGAGGFALLDQMMPEGVPPKWVLGLILAKMLQQAASDFGKNAKPKA